MKVIVGAVNNLLFIPATGANQQTGAMLPVLDEQTTFAMLFQNAENGLDGEIAESESETSVPNELLKESKDDEQPSLDLLGLALANSFPGNQTGNPDSAEKADGNTSASVGAVDSQTGRKPLGNLTAFMTERVHVSEAAMQAEPKRNANVGAAYGLNTEAKTEPVMNRAGFTEAAESTASSTYVNHSVNNVPFGGFNANPRPEQNSEPEVNFNAFVTQSNSHEANAGQSNRTAFFAETAVFENAAVPAQANETVLPKSISFSAEYAQPMQENAFQSNLKAIRAEMDAKTGFRQSGKTESIMSEASKSAGRVQNGITFENATAKQVPQDVKTANGFETKNAFGQSTVQKAAGFTKAEPEFEIQLKEKASGTDFPDLNMAAVQNTEKVHSTAAVEVQETQTQTDIVTQLEAPIKKEASKGANTSFKIKLKPEGLGEVTVDLKHISGKLEVSIKTELTSTKELISDSLNTLRSALSADDGSKTLSLVSLTVEQDGRHFGAFSQSGFNEERHNRSFSGNTFSGFDETAEQKNFSTAKYKSGLIDYTV